MGQRGWLTVGMMEWRRNGQVSSEFFVFCDAFLFVARRASGVYLLTQKRYIWICLSIYLTDEKTKLPRVITDSLCFFVLLFLKIVSFCPLRSKRFHCCFPLAATTNTSVHAATIRHRFNSCTKCSCLVTFIIVQSPDYRKLFVYNDESISESFNATNPSTNVGGFDGS